MCLLKNPWFCVVNEGYPPPPLRFNLDVASHMTGEPLTCLVGLDRPLAVMLSPGLAHPPPGTGDGLLDNDISEIDQPKPHHHQSVGRKGNWGRVDG
jgi:hypothetical protein